MQIVPLYTVRDMGPQVFTPSTCDALIDLLLRESAGAADVAARLQEIAAEDDCFARWLNSSESCEAREASLAERLIRCAKRRTDELDRLWQVANMALRLQTLERRFVEELDARKREAIYHFAYGLSHELNNPLANIATRAGVLAQYERAADRRQMLETIVDNAMRGSEMLGDLMLVARPPAMQLQAVELSKWFEQFVERARKWAATRDVKIAASNSTRTSVGQFCPVAISEALWCLVRNAIEASSPSDTVQVAMSDSDAGLLWTVSDSGPGLSATALKHCFDPYFSGREAGRGLGLGLTKAQMIATAHHGSVTIANRPTGGCLSQIHLQHPSDD